MKRPANKPPKRSAPRTQRIKPGQVTPAPETPREVMKVFTGYWLRMLLTLLLTLLSAALIAFAAHLAHSLWPALLFMSALFGLLVSSRRGLVATFEKLRALGEGKLKQHRYADAVYILENFHRMGNMGFDKDGRAHYLLMLAYSSMGETERAAGIADWLQRYRSKSEYAASLAKKQAVVHDAAPPVS